MPLILDHIGPRSQGHQPAAVPFSLMQVIGGGDADLVDLWRLEAPARLSAE
jgi:hypothetical protein